MTHLSPTPTVTNRSHLAISKVGRLLVLLMTCGVATDCRMVFADDPRAVIRGVMEAIQPSPAPDYVEMINAPLRGTANAENNFFAALFPMVALEELDESQGLWVDRLCKEIGCVHPVEQPLKIRSPKMVEYDETIDVHAIQDEWFDAAEKLWDPGQFPLTNAWIEENQIALDYILSETSRPTSYRPMIPVAGGSLITTRLPDIQLSRVVGLLGSARVMRLLREDELDKARRDLLALNRLASHLGQSGNLVQLLCAQEVKHVLQASQAAYLGMPGISPEDRKEYLRELNSIPPMRDVHTIYSASERLSMLHAIDEFRLGYVDTTKPKHERTTSDEGYSFIVRLMIGVFVDWPDVRRGLEREYEIVAECLEIVNADRRMAALHAHVDSLGAHLGKTGSPELETQELLFHRMLEASRLEARERRGERIGQLLACLLIADAITVDLRQTRQGVRTIMLPVLVAALNYRDVHGHWPRLQTDLSEEGNTLPHDPLNGGDFHFEERGSRLTIYSLGNDGLDQGGRFNLSSDDPCDDVAIDFPIINPTVTVLSEPGYMKNVAPGTWTIVASWTIWGTLLILATGLVGKGCLMMFRGKSTSTHSEDVEDPTP